MLEPSVCWWILQTIAGSAIKLKKQNKKCWFLLTEILTIFLGLAIQTISVGRRKFSANFQLVFRLIKGLIFVTFISILVILIALPHMTPKDIVVCILAFLPTGWGLLLVSFISPSFSPCFVVFLLNVHQWRCQSSFHSLNLFCFYSNRLLKHASRLFKKPDSGVQFELLHVAMRSWWGCFFLHLWHFLHGSRSCLNSKLECCSTKRSAEVFRFLVFLVATAKTDPQGIRSRRGITVAMMFAIPANFLLPKCSYHYHFASPLVC